jgi:hypothetical protein
VRAAYQERAKRLHKRPRDLAISDYFKGKNLLLKKETVVSVEQKALDDEAGSYKNIPLNTQGVMQPEGTCITPFHFPVHRTLPTGPGKPSEIYTGLGSGDACQTSMPPRCEQYASVVHSLAQTLSIQNC